MAEQLGTASDIDLSVLPSSNGVLWYCLGGPAQRYRQRHTDYAVEPAQAAVLMYQADLNGNFKEIFYSRLLSVSFMTQIS